MQAEIVHQTWSSARGTVLLMGALIMTLYSVTLQQLDEMRRDLRWITDALQYARYKKPRSGVPIPRLVDTRAPDCNSSQDTSGSTSSAMEYMASPSPSPSPKLDRRKTISCESRPLRVCF